MEDESDDEARVATKGKKKKSAVLSESEDEDDGGEKRKRAVLSDSEGEEDTPKVQ